ncbi:hypothetical protein [Quadrisphaera sp. DSM 44207]|uniref:DUF4190 domain-containing protein n=1 Tax=Quadrisphaera sp. DSM 44207 TaxID=1881057 RepID=UPI001C40A8CC|nr:hypothetical protein [Quadrisphaera sp. DSM 44207]
MSQMPASPYASPAPGPVAAPSAGQRTEVVRSTDVMAVLGLVFAFVLPPLGIVFSALGLRNTGRDGTGGRGLAIAGMLLSLLFTAAVALIFV